MANKIFKLELQDIEKDLFFFEAVEESKVAVLRIVTPDGPEHAFILDERDGPKLAAVVYAWLHSRSKALPVKPRGKR